ncbi:hypothetical protein LTR08_004900 [Meristemomyces frigidus]|nr:hypothetical protein LTR08_004900 [Meristemomyces frigidus]
MKAATRLFASVAKGAQYLEPGTPTGLTGLLTHAAPRTALLFTYTSTLEKLKQFPESSVYRQSTEALTRHRMAIMESVKPAGLEEWQARVSKTIDEYPEAFRKVPVSTGSGKTEYNVVWKASTLTGMATDEWDDEAPSKPMLEGARSRAEQERQMKQLLRDPVAEHQAVPRIEPEPPLSAEQINQVETEIGAGLIEEVIQVAEGERELVDTLAASKAWEDLEEKPAQGQWAYFERDTHTPTTQAR